VEPTDEYTPTHADNDVLRLDDPPFWLSSNPAAFAPGTLPNPLATDPHYNGTPDAATTLSAPAPPRLRIHATEHETLVLNLRDYPNWDVTVHMPGYIDTDRPHHIPREDGLLAIPLNPGDSTIDITWHRTLDQQLGLALSSIALCIYVALLFIQRSRRIED
jgi:hypothetical protein